MPHTIKFELGFAPETVEHLAAIERKHYQLIQKTLDEQLLHVPDQETRNRKPVEQPAPFGATWELRFGPGNYFASSTRWTIANGWCGFWRSASRYGIVY